MTFQEFKDQYEKVPVKECPNTVSENPLVSVCVQTYQHAPYIRKCLDGILMQKTNFDVEILLGEDASNDGTREICIEYAEKYPNQIRLFLHRRENNIHLYGSPSGRFNFVYNLLSARGKYLALCEGDDYWTDPLKLQKQYETILLTSTRLCFHDFQFCKGTKFSRVVAGGKSVISAKDFIKGNDIRIHTATIFFENLPNLIVDKIFEFLVGDKYLILKVGEYGNFSYLAESMSVYRLHAGGIWNSAGSSLKHKYNYLESYSEILHNFNQNMNFKYNDVINERIGKDFYNLLSKSLSVDMSNNYTVWYRNVKDLLPLKYKLRLFVKKIIKKIT